MRQRIINNSFQGLHIMPLTISRRNSGGYNVG
jgi:hypothetical protein